LKPATIAKNPKHPAAAHHAYDDQLPKNSHAANANSNNTNPNDQLANGGMDDMNSNSAFSVAAASRIPPIRNRTTANDTPWPVKDATHCFTCLAEDSRRPETSFILTIQQTPNRCVPTRTTDAT
jgi:hypothetical protein